MPDWPASIGLLLGGIAAGVLVTRHMWLKAVQSSAPPAWMPPAVSTFLFGNFAKSAQEQQRTRAENQSLRRELKQFSSMLNLAPFPIWRRNKELDIIYCNLEYNAMLEEMPERILEEYGLELGPHARQLAEKAKAGNGIANEERHLVIQGGRRLYQVYEIPDPDLGGTVGFALDVTERERVEEELRRNITAHSDLLEASNLATAIFGADKRLKFFNSAFVGLWKLDREWLDNEPGYGEFLELLREKRRIPEVTNFPMFKQQRLKLFNDLMGPHEEISHMPDGRILRMVTIPHALGGLIFSYEDVTDKVALESSYNTLIAVQRETLNNLHEGVAVFGEDGRLRLSNPTYQKLWGLSQTFLDTEPHIGEILEASRQYYNYQDWEEFKQRMIAQLHVRKMNYQRIERTEGSVIDWSTVPLPDGATLITYFDVTDSTLVERSLIEKNEALREADRLKTEFLLSVSYELRSPLTSITGFAELLMGNYFGKLSVRQQEYIKAIHDSAGQLGDLINNILDLASIEAGYMRLEVNECPIRNLLRDVFSLVQERARSNHQSLRLECAKEIGSMQVDEARIKQVLFNLLNNSVKYTPARGTITMGAAIDNENTILLWVEDTGTGIPEEEQRTAFERFRAGGVRTQRSGAGLGLAMVKNFIELHGGRVELESVVGKGTRVSCYIPRHHTVIYVPHGRAISSASPLAKEHQH